MSQSPERPKPPKLVPGEPLWGTPEISPPGQQPPPSPAPEKRRSGSAATGTARPPAGRAQAAPPPPGPVQFGATPTPQAPPATGYGQARTYGGPDFRDAHPTPPNAVGERPTGLLIAVAAAFFLLGAATGVAVGWLLL